MTDYRSMTREERERRAYADGNVQLAALLAVGIDYISERELDLDWEVRHLKDDICELERELAEK